jgi:hypothetical protein
MSATVAADGAGCCAEAFTMICSLLDPITQLDIRSHRVVGTACLWHSPRDGAVGSCGAAVKDAGDEGQQVRNQICARNCARDAAGQAETEETQKIRNGLAPQACRGQRRDRRRSETAETCVVWLITQRSRVQIPPPLLFSQVKVLFLPGRGPLAFQACSKTCSSNTVPRSPAARRGRRRETR